MKVGLFFYIRIFKIHSAMIRLKKYRNKKTGQRVIELEDLSFLFDRNRFNWLSRHFYNYRCKKACRKADKILVPNEQLAYEVTKYYFVPKYKIYLNSVSKQTKSPQI